MFQARAEFFVNGEEVFRCPATTFALKNSAESLLVLEHMGPNVLSEAQQCAERD